MNTSWLDRYNLLKMIHNVLHSSLSPSIKELFISDLSRKLDIPTDDGLSDSVKIMRTFSANTKVVNLQIRKIEERLFKWIVQRGVSSQTPGQHVFKGSYVIGEVVGSSVQATIDFSLENNLAIIFSKSGGGKTNLMYNIVPQALNKQTSSGNPLHIHIYEMAKREAIYLLSRYPSFLVNDPGTPFNVFYPPHGMDPFDYNSVFWELACQELGIRDETRIFLEEETARFFESKGVTGKNIDDTCPTLPEFIDHLHDKFVNAQTRVEKNSRSIIATALKHFQPLCRKFRGALNVRRGVLQGDGHKFSDHDIIFEMGWPGLTGKEKRLLAKLHVRYSRLERELAGEAQDIELLLIFEEAKYIWGTDKTNRSTIDYMKQEIDEGRALGMAFLGMSQHIDDFADFITNSAAYCICLPLGKHGILNASRAMECSEFDIRRLHIPYGIMNIPTHPGGFRVKLKKASIDQKNRNILLQTAGEKLKPFLENVIKSQETSTETPTETPTIEELEKPVQVKMAGKALEELASFLYYIRQNPDHKCLSELYDTFGVGREKGTKLKNELVGNGLAQLIKVQDGGRKRPAMHLQITDQGSQWLCKTLNENG